MQRAILQYFKVLMEEFGEGWNRFWFTPRASQMLGVLRILTGLVALYVHGTYSFDLIRLFGPDGILPVDVVQQLGADRTTFSYLNYLSSPGEIWALHLLGGMVLVAFTLGWFSRVTSVLALLVVLSTIHRAPMVTGEMEPVLAMLLFYLALGPSGDSHSLDRMLRRKRSGPLLPAKEEDPVAPATVSANVAQRLIQIHVCLIYLMMGIAKLAGDTWWQGDAVWWLIARPESRLVDLTWLADKIYVLNAWTHAIVLFELLFPILVWNRLARPLLLAIAVPIWVASALITGMVTFCVLMLVANLSFVSPEALRTWYSSNNEGRAD